MKAEQLHFSAGRDGAEGKIALEEPPSELAEAAANLKALGFQYVDWNLVVEEGHEAFRVDASLKFDLQLPEIPLIEPEDGWEWQVEMWATLDEEQNIDVGVMILDNDGFEQDPLLVKPEAWNAVEEFFEVLKPLAAEAVGAYLDAGENQE